MTQKRKVLIIGSGSYVGTNLKFWLEPDFSVDELDVKNQSIDFNFSPYHSVVHVAAIVHNTNKGLDYSTYHRVNTILAYEVALRASAVNLLKMIATAKNRKIKFSKLGGFFLSFLWWHTFVIKVYGGVSYCKESFNHFDGRYQLFEMSKGIERSLFPKK